MADVDASEEELQVLLGRAIANRPWPDVGMVVTMSFDWDGRAVLHSDEYLSLKAGERVKIEGVSEKGGYFYGTVMGTSGRNGWFGGPGCEATVQVDISVPVGNGSDDGPSMKPGEMAPPPNGREPLRDGELADDVEAYLDRHQIDSGAAETLRNLEPAVQAEVISRDITNSRNPSAVLLSRIDRVAKGKPAHSVPKGGISKGKDKDPFHQAGSRARSRSPPPTRQHPYINDTMEARPMAARGKGGNNREVEDFILKEGLDERNAAELRALAWPEQQVIVRTDLTNARNPNAVVNSRIQSVKGNEAQRFAVEDYVTRNSIDQTAAEALLALPPDKQELIMSSDLSSARNPSAVLLSRIRGVEAQMATAIGQPAPPANWQPPPPDFAHGGHRAPASSRNSSPGMASARGRSREHTQAEEYIVTHGLDERIADQLRALSPGELAQVMATNLTNARNPSAVVKTRIERVRGQNQQRDVLEEYLHRYQVDEGAKQTARDLPPELQQKIVEQEMSNCRNPSAVLLSRIRGMQKGERP